MAGIFVEGIKRSGKPFPGTWEQAESVHQEDTQLPECPRMKAVTDGGHFYIRAGCGELKESPCHSPSPQRTCLWCSRREVVDLAPWPAPQSPKWLRFEETQGAPRGPQVASALGTLVESAPRSRISGSVWW